MGAAFVRLVARRPLDRLRLGQQSVRRRSIPRKLRAQQHLGGGRGGGSADSGDGRAVAQRQSPVAPQWIAALYFESRRWPRRVPGPPDAPRHPPPPAAPPHRPPPPPPPPP